MLGRRPLLTAALVLACLLAPAAVAGAASTVKVAGSTLFYSDAANAADDVALAFDSAANAYVLTRQRAGVALAPGDASCSGGPEVVTCSAGAVENVSIYLAGGADRLDIVSTAADSVSANGADGSDVLNGGPGPEQLAGGNGADTIDGGGGLDGLFGDGDADTLKARDGVGERVDCGTGADTATLDQVDSAAGCETEDRSRDAQPDFDGDGYVAPDDCNDRDPGIHPGAYDGPASGADEDCDGADSPLLDADRDGFPIPGDCRDSDPAVHPGAKEVRGNKIDENCDGKADPYGEFDLLTPNSWRIGRNTGVASLIARGAPKGATIDVRCRGRGCPFKRKVRKVVKDNLGVNLKPLFGRARLRPGASIEVRASAEGFFGQVAIFRMRARDLPTESRRCLAPGKSKSQPC